MANARLENASIWRLDTSYFFWNKPLWIKKIVLYPSAVSDAAAITCYNPAATARATQSDKSVAVATSNTITSTGNFEAAELVSGDMFVITKTDVTAGDPNYGVNTGTFIASRTSDDVAVLYGHDTATPLTDDASGTYSWKTIAGTVVIALRCSEDSLVTEELDFGDDGLRLPNFALTSLSNTSVVYVYLR